MKFIFFLLIILTVSNCNKPKSVLICGDHICINKAEAEQYFEDNLSLEVRIIDNKKKRSNDLVELNLNTNSDGKKEISLSNKKETNKKIKILSNREIERKKIELKEKKKIKSRKKPKVVKLKETKIEANKKKIITNNIDNKIEDICIMLKNCSIDEISEYLVKQGKKRKFPNIAVRDN